MNDEMVAAAASGWLLARACHRCTCMTATTAKVATTTATALSTDFSTVNRIALSLDLVGRQAPLMRSKVRTSPCKGCDGGHKTVDRARIANPRRGSGKARLGAWGCNGATRCITFWTTEDLSTDVLPLERESLPIWARRIRRQGCRAGRP